MIRVVVGLFMALSSILVWAGNSGVSDTPAVPTKADSSRYLALSIDNDLFAPGNSDKDYTAGVAITLQNLQHNLFTSTLDTPLGAIDRFLIDQGENTAPGFEFGSYGFTPDDIESRQLDRSDRPYASIVYFSALRRYQTANNRDFWTSALTLGVLGTDVFKSGQKTIHRLITGDEARGWDKQVSEGGELTARYQLAYHHPLGGAVQDHQLKLSYFGSLGYISEAGIAFSFRRGLISSPDYRFNPAVTSYGEQSNASDAGPGGRESYFWGGFGLKARAYNAFLEGQFRHSEHTISRARLRLGIAEFWAGYTASLFKTTKLSYVFRAQSSEIKGGTGDRHLMWGGLVLSRALD